MNGLGVRGGRLTAAAATLVLGGVAATCTMDAVAPLGTGGAAGGPMTTSSTSTTSPPTSSSTGAGGAGGAGGVVCPDEPVPPSVPAGWEHYGDWACQCSFYVPPTPELLPAPLGWEPCPAAPGGMACQRLVLGPGEDLFVVPSIDRTASGDAILDLIRTRCDGQACSTFHLVAEADGPVRSAIFVDWQGKSWNDIPCLLDNEGLCRGHFVHEVTGRDAMAGHLGAVGGAFDAPRPTALLNYIVNSVYNDDWRCTDTRVLRLGHDFVLETFRWDMSGGETIWSPALDPEGLIPGPLDSIGDTVFFSTATPGINGLNVWTPQTGARPFMRFIGDATRGADDLGTDGTDLVWAYGEGKSPAEMNYPVRAIMTAPFTADPVTAAATMRRVRSNPTATIGLYPFAVGCGYAAQRAGNSLYVARLGDGRMWMLDDTPELDFVGVVGTTCDEVFVMAAVSQRASLLRIRLDSLGLGLPAD